MLPLGVWVVVIVAMRSEGDNPKSMEGVLGDRADHLAADHPFHHDVTAHPAVHPTTQLTQAARNLTKAAAITDLFTQLRDAGAGTNSVESQALGLAKERNVKEGNGDLNSSKAAARDPEMVRDMLDVKLKYVKRAEVEARREYHAQLGVARRAAGSYRVFSRIVGTVKQEQNMLWETLVKENERKVAHLKQKHISSGVTSDNSASCKVKPTCEEEEILRYTEITDCVLEDVGEVPVYGDVSLDDDELSILKKPPKFAMFGKVDLFSFFREVQVANTKLRWHRREHGYGEEEDGNVAEEYPEKNSFQSDQEGDRELEMQELCTRETFDPIEKRFDFRKKRTTDVKTNQRVYLPQPRPLREEAELSVRNDAWEAEIRKYRKEFCDEEGLILAGCNLTESERRGLKKLKKRAEDGDIVIGTTDKSGKLCVSSMESYIRQGRKHVGDDREVDWPEIYRIRKRMSCHAKVLVKIFNIGKSHGDGNVMRVEGAYQQECDTIPILFTLPKDHSRKEENGDPRTRPVCGAKRSVNGRVGNLISEVLRAVIEGEETDECISTEEMLHHMEVAAKEIAGQGGVRVTVASEDAEALYPSLDIEQSARICAERVRGSEVEFAGIDYEWALKYIAMNFTNEDVAQSKIRHLLPVRKHKKGPRPGIVSVDKEEECSKWILRQNQLTEVEKKQILAEVVYIAVKTVFKNHLYQFEGVVRIQRQGGAIGGELTQIVARVVMDKWMEMFKEKMKENNVNIFLAKKYVDDVNLLLQTLKKGTKWNGDSLEWRKEWEEEDLADGEDDDIRTMREIRKLSNSLLNFIKFKEDVPANHESKKIPVLDLQVWREEEYPEKNSFQSDLEGEAGEAGLKTKLMWEFYEKPMASKFVIMENSALPQRMKITTLSQEIIRRMRNTCRNISSKRRGEILSVYMRKLQRSGYSVAMREKVAIAGLRGYLRMVKVEEEGGRKVNRPRQDGEEERRYKRLAGKSSWFRGSRGGGGATVMMKPQRKQRRPKKQKEAAKEIDTVMFVSHTPGDLLAKNLQKAEDKFVEKRPGGKVKMVSRGGTALQNVLCNKNPWQKEGCGRHNCFVCGSGNPGGCQKEGILYSITCQECRSRGILACYWGEASRSGFLRGLDHQSLLKSKDDSSPLWKHSVEHHNAREDVVYSMKVERSWESPLNRQVDESTAIERSKAQIPMNSRSEWNSQRIPRIVVQVQGENELEDDEKLPTMETWTVHVPTVSMKQERRRSGPQEDEKGSPVKRRRVGDSPRDDPEEDAAAPEAAEELEEEYPEKNSFQSGKKLDPALGEGDSVGQGPRAAPAPMMGTLAKAMKKPSKGKKQSQFRNKITNYFILQDVKKTKELESVDSLSLESAAAEGEAAGVGSVSNADSSSEREEL